ncbi:MAG: cell division protein FtsZ [Nitrospirae bacterium]|nr:cell division protein FtsZ [Nitrospirota bacterium]
MFKLAEEEPTFGAKIKVFGVGGCGCNAIKNMFQSHVRGVELIAANTDAQHLEKRAKADKKIQLGPGSTRGLGAGGDPERGKTAAQESREEIRKVLEGADMAFITAGMGGGTGTGAAPVVAQIAKEMGILTVGVVTRPLADEGPRRQKHAEEGLREMRNYTDTIIVIPNQRLLAVAGDRDLREAFKKADDVLINAVRGISDIITVPGLVNRDFADIKSVMQEMGLAMMGIGLAQGENRAKEAAEFAISSPLLEDVSIQGAKAILVNFTGYSMTLNEVHQAIDYIRQQAGDQAHLLWGAVYNKNKKFKDTLRVTVIATGFGTTKREETTARTGNVRELSDYDSPTWLRRKRQEKPETAEKEVEPLPPAPQQAASVNASAKAAAAKTAAGYGGVTIHERSRVETTDEDYDIPTFLRRRPD